MTALHMELRDHEGLFPVSQPPFLPKKKWQGELSAWEVPVPGMSSACPESLRPSLVAFSEPPAASPAE